MLERVLALVSILVLWAPPAVQSSSISQDELKSLCRGYEAAFELVDLNTGETIRLNPALCAKRQPPCSTFKIFNSLVGLDTGVLPSENHSMRWDGTKYDISDWNRDQTLQSAVTNSVVWYFQRVASSVGAKRMQRYIDLAPYGNRDISSGITNFWLSKSLKVSADEQVSLLKRLINDDLPFSKRSMAIVRGLIRLDQTDRGTLYGKTGSGHLDDRNGLGWFVGYVVQPGGSTYVFATNIQAASSAWGPKARDITREILKKLELL